MANKIRIAAGGVFEEATLNDSKTAKAIKKALPIEATAQTWGDEIYFSIGVNIQPEQPQATVGMGELAYWPPGTAFCIFFGPSPMSTGDEIRRPSPGIRDLLLPGGDMVFKLVHSGTAVTITEA